MMNIYCTNKKLITEHVGVMCINQWREPVGRQTVVLRALEMPNDQGLLAMNIAKIDHIH